MACKSLMVALAVAAALLASWVQPPPLHAANPDEGAPRLIRVAIDDNYPPYIFRNDKGQIQGILVDLWRLWEQKTGIRVVLLAMDWSHALDTMKSGGADVIDTIFFTEARSRIYDYSKPYATINVPVFFHRTLSGISGVGSLLGFRIGVKRGDACIDVFKSHGIEKGLVEYDSYEAIVKDAAMGRIRVFCIDEPPAFFFLNKYDILDQFHYTDPLYSGEFHRAVAKGNTRLLAIVERGFASITDEERQAIEKKWSGYRVPVPRYLRYVLPGLGMLALLLFAVTGFSLALRRQVTLRTRELSETNERLQEEIRERARVEEALRASEELYRLLADNASDVIFTMDTELRFTYVSPSVKRLRGIEVHEAMTQSVKDALTPESLKTAMAVYGEELALEESGNAPKWRTRTLELEEYRKDGSTVWTETTFSPLRDKNGKLTGFLGITRDITERRRSQEERARLEAALAQTQRLESLGTLAGGVAHDFNNILAGILGNVSLVRMGMPENDPRAERLKNVEEYVRRGSDLTRQLLGFARGGRYETRPTHLGTLLKKSSELFGRTRKEVTIHFDCAEGLWSVEVDRAQMEQVLLNLYMNAWQAMPEGGDIFLSLENVEIGEENAPQACPRPGRYVRMTVRDTGEGMDESTLSHIFDPFFTTKERSRGTGLGLASVYGIVRNHGGFLEVASEKGKGSAFMVYLPASDKAPTDEIQAATELRKGDETILLIDDEAMIRDVGKRMLESLGYRVITASGGKEGLTLFEQHRGSVSLVILDMIMPEMGGKETFAMLRRMDPAAKVLLASGYSLDSHAQELMDHGCDGFIQKPFTLADLSLKVRQVLERADQGTAA